MSLLDFSKQVIQPYFTDPRIGQYINSDNAAGVAAIAFLPHPKFKYSFPPTSIRITGPELVLVTPPGELRPMINNESYLIRQYDLWIKAWESSELICEEIACELFTALSPNAIRSYTVMPSEKRGSPSAYCIKLKEWVHNPRH